MRRVLYLLYTAADAYNSHVDYAMLVTLYGNESAAMVTGLMDQVWSIKEIAKLVVAPEAKKRGPYKKQKPDTLGTTVKSN